MLSDYERKKGGINHGEISTTHSGSEFQPTPFHSFSVDEQVPWYVSVAKSILLMRPSIMNSLVCENYLSILSVLPSHGAKEGLEERVYVRHGK
jgi:hypothetical protein